MERIVENPGFRAGVSAAEDFFGRFLISEVHQRCKLKFPLH